MSRVRFWSIYFAAWLPFALSYYVLFRMLPYDAQPVRQTFYNIAPAAALGSLILPWTRFLPWTLHRRWWFYPSQVGSAVGYSLLWYCGVLLTSSAGTAIVTHRIVIGYFSYYALQWQAFSGVMIYGNIAGILYVWQVNERLRQEESRRALAESLQTTAELSALRAQLNPHFLFNTLNSIMALAGPEQPRTMQAISELAAMLRYTLNRNTEREGVSLRQELAFTDQYLALESLRLGERLLVVQEIAPEALACRVPPLTLQPLVENAIRHGIAPRAEKGTLTLRAHLEQSVLCLAIEDDGVGCGAATLGNAGGLGLRTVRQRLELFSNGRASFELDTAPRHGCRLSIRLPLDKAVLASPEDAIEADWTVA